ncbi:hypothetical protein ABTZ03_14660 [Kitasatospora sp. NPDC096077]|uniref:hypothetical protein n=1 Tax=unclassified Kitasatospora TaxID=2633591 RepID=UPI00332A2930
MNDAVEPSRPDHPNESGSIIEASPQASRPEPSGLLGDTVVLVRVESLLPADSPRVAGESDAHVRLLAEVDEPLPPIVVRRDTGQVVDGMHRVRAAALRGQEFIRARLFEGRDEDAFVLAVRLNHAHGLPLTEADRTSSAERIIASHPQWSDRRIAEASGLAARTVAAVRRRSTADHPQLNARLGRDGRIRPLNAAEGRLLASRLMADDPTASLREVADAAGIAVATARDVRQRMLRSQDVVPPRQRRRQPSPGTGVGGPVDTMPQGQGAAYPANSRTLESLRKDPSLRLSDSGRQLLQLLNVHLAKPDQWNRLAHGVPTHRADAVALMARACAEQWLEFARAMDGRSETAGPPSAT